MKLIMHQESDIMHARACLEYIWWDQCADFNGLSSIFVFFTDCVNSSASPQKCNSHSAPKTSLVIAQINKFHQTRWCVNRLQSKEEASLVFRGGPVFKPHRSSLMQISSCLMSELRHSTARFDVRLGFKILNQYAIHSENQTMLTAQVCYPSNIYMT